MANPRKKISIRNGEYRYIPQPQSFILNAVSNPKDIGQKRKRARKRIGSGANIVCKVARPVEDRTGPQKNSYVSLIKKSAS
jgi:hypothetical protein